MREVFLTVGPQGSGKSTFCEKLLPLHRNLALVSRDNILMELFGTVFLGSYDGGHYVARDKMWHAVGTKLQQESCRIILDTWNGFDLERRHIVAKLCSLSVDRVEAWIFNTPESVTTAWRVQKETERLQKEGRKLTDCWGTNYHESFRRDYELYHSELPGGLERYVDAVRWINPLEITPENFSLSPTPT